MLTTLALAAAALAGPAPVRAPAAPAVVPTRAEPRYCMKNERTGSRMAQKECRTRDEWLTRNIDPLGKD